jgi:hypothetical protein
MGVSMKDFSKMAIVMAKESLSGQMGSPMKDPGKMVICMAKES